MHNYVTLSNKEIEKERFELQKEDIKLSKYLNYSHSLHAVYLTSHNILNKSENATSELFATYIQNYETKNAIESVS